MIRNLLIITILCTIFVYINAQSSPFSFRHLLKPEYQSRRLKQSNPRKIIPNNVQTGYLEQRLDNFDPSNAQTFQQRFYSNDQFYEPNGPIFIFLSGNYFETGPQILEQGLWYDYADELNAHMFHLENRFWGESIPTPNLSVENLRHLNTPQIVADVAHFIEFIKSTYPSTNNASVILIGSHYSASLAVWTRQRYSHLVDGVWASSAPLRSEVNQISFKEVVGAVYRTEGGPECYDVIDNAFNEMEEMIQNGQVEELQYIFAMCEPIDLDNEMDVAFFFEFVSEILGIIVQFAAPSSINYICEFMNDPELARDIYGVANLIKDVAAEGGCIPINYDMVVEFESGIELDSPNVIMGARQWGYLACSEIGWFHTSDSRFQPFGDRFTMELFHQFCMDVFGDQFNNSTLMANSDRFNIEFGGIHLHNIDNVIYTHGWNDPWRPVGIQTDQNENAEAHVIRGFAQSFDLEPIGGYDTQEMIDLKLRILELITQWVR